MWWVLYFSCFGTFTKINDHANNSTGYEGCGQTISYDLNGNMKTMPDKYISNIDYNFLNLPSRIERAGINLDYKYNASGVKLQKFNPKSECGIINCYTIMDVTDYLDGFQYLKSTMINNGEKDQYIYQYKDHLGNVRVTRSYSKLDFSGVPQKTETQHIRKTGEAGITVK